MLQYLANKFLAHARQNHQQFPSRKCGVDLCRHHNMHTSPPFTCVMAPGLCRE